MLSASCKYEVLVLSKRLHCSEFFLIVVFNVKIKGRWDLKAGNASLKSTTRSASDQAPTAVWLPLSGNSDGNIGILLFTLATKLQTEVIERYPAHLFNC